MAQSKTIYFPPSNLVPKEAQPVREQVQPKVPEKNSLEAYRDALVGASNVDELLRGLLRSTNRHGDLMAARSQALLVLDNLEVLIAAEES